MEIYHSAKIDLSMGFRARLSPNKSLLGTKEEAHSCWLDKVKVEKLGHMGI